MSVVFCIVYDYICDALVNCCAMTDPDNASRHDGKKKVFQRNVKSVNKHQRVSSSGPDKYECLSNMEKTLEKMEKEFDDPDRYRSSPDQVQRLKDRENLYDLFAVQLDQCLKFEYVFGMWPTLINRIGRVAPDRFGCVRKYDSARKRVLEFDSHSGMAKYKALYMGLSSMCVLGSILIDKEEEVIDGSSEVVKVDWSGNVVCEKIEFIEFPVCLVLFSQYDDCGLGCRLICDNEFGCGNVYTSKKMNCFCQDCAPCHIDSNLRHNGLFGLDEPKFEESKNVVTGFPQFSFPEESNERTVEDMLGVMDIRVKESVLTSLFDHKYEEMRLTFAKCLIRLINFQIDSYVREERSRMFQRQTEFKRFKNNFWCPRECDRNGQVGLCEQCLKNNYGRRVKFKDKVGDFQICSIRDFINVLGLLITQGSINLVCEKCMRCDLVLRFEISNGRSRFVDVKFECYVCGQVHKNLSTKISIFEIIPFYYDLDVKIVRDRSLSVISVSMVEIISSRYGQERPWVDAYDFNVEE